MAWALLCLTPLEAPAALAETAETSLDEASGGESSPAESASNWQRLQQSRQLVEDLPDARPKALLLLDLVEACLARPCGTEPSSLLEQAGPILEGGKDPEQRIEDLIRVVQLQRRLGQPEQAAQRLRQVRQQAVRLPPPDSEEARLRRAQLLLQISLAEENGDTAPGDDDFLAQSQALLKQPVKPEPFPFRERPTRLELGLGVGGNSYTDLTVRADLSVDLYKQWPRQDLYLDGFFALDYDSSRSVNNFRPIGLATIIYRRHLNRKWNLFYDQLTSVNSTTFSTDDDDQDLSAISASYAGVGLNLWRGDDPGSFLDLQLGIGPRYQYEYIDYERKKDKLGAALGLILVGRKIPIGASRLSIILGSGAYMDDWEDAVLLFDSTLDIPLSRRWSWSNRLVLRYLTDPIAERYPKMNALFSTGFTFKFTP